MKIIVMLLSGFIMLVLGTGIVVLGLFLLSLFYRLLLHSIRSIKK